MSPHRRALTACQDPMEQWKAVVDVSGHHRSMRLHHTPIDGQEAVAVPGPLSYWGASEEADRLNAIQEVMGS